MRLKSYNLTFVNLWTPKTFYALLAGTKFSSALTVRANYRCSRQPNKRNIVHNKHFCEISFCQLQALSNILVLWTQKTFYDYLAVVFPRDGTSRGTSRDKPGRDVPLSLCPGTRAGANVPGQTLLSRDVPGQNCPQKTRKKTF